MTESELRSEICRVGKSLYERGYVHSSAGNISALLDDGMLITPTDACLGTLQAGLLAKIDANGLQVGGAPASKTLALHRAIYAADPQARCVLHTHSTHLVAATLLRSADAKHADVLPPITPYFVMKVGHVPLIAYRRPGDPEAAALLTQQIGLHARRGTPLRAALLDRLGPVVWHASPAAASAVLEELEETARLHVLAPDAAPLGESQIEELRRIFGALW
jgi:3-dehydro-4-phosphotetronate decarboxylase